MSCPQCHTENPEGAKFCMSCGSPLALACPSCGSDLPAGAKFCMHCGHRIGEEAPAAEPAESKLSQYIPQELLNKLETARAAGRMQGERRVVTMLFCDVKGSTAAAEQLDPEDWAEIMNGAFEHLMPPVYRYEGTLARLMGDAILAFFGAPIAHEDDPERAVLAGLAILEDVRSYKETVKQRWGLDFDVRVGINTGLVVVGEVGSDLRVEYTALGDAVNLAARMEQTAEPGTIQITEQTQRLIAPLFEFQSLGAIEVKGKAEPVNAYRVLQPKEAPGRLRGIEGLTSTMVGRQREVDELRGVVADLRRGTGRIVSVMGEAGIGKSRLVAEMRQEAAAEAGIDWHEGRSLSYQSSMPYAPFASLLSRMLGVPSGASDPERYLAMTAGVERVAPGDSESLSPFLATVLGIEVPEAEAEPIRYLKPPDLRERVFNAVRTLVGRLAATQPTVLVFEDLHWADVTSVDLIESLLPFTDTCMLMLLAAFRPERSDPSWRFHEAAEREFDHRYTPLELRPLDPRQSADLVDELLNEGALPATLRSTVLARTEGNPFFVEEVLRSLMEDGTLIRGDSGWHVEGEARQIAVPDTLNAVLSARLDQLDEESKQVAQVAAVVGREFSVEALGALDPGAANLDGPLMTLQRRGLIRETSRVPRRVFAFKHWLTQDTAYNSLLLSTRRVLHARMADWLQSEEPDRVGDIARHLLEAQQYDRALPYAVVAGDQAARAFAMNEAIDWYHRAIDIVPRVDNVPLARQGYEGLGFAQQFASDIAGAVATYEAMARFAKEQADQPMEVSALNKLAFVKAMRYGDVAQAEELLSTSEGIAQECGERPGLAELNMIYCYIRTSAGELDNAYDRLTTAAKIGRELEMIEPKLFGMVHVAHTLNYMTRFDEARAAAEDAMAVAQEAGHLGWEAELRGLTMPLYMMAAGDFEGALKSAQEGNALAKRIGAVDREASACLVQTMINHQLGRYSDSLAAAEETINAAQTAGLPYLEAVAHTEMAAVKLDISPALAGEAKQLNVRALELMEQPLGTALGGIVWASVGFASLQTGDADTAKGLFEQGLATPTGIRLFAQPQLHLGLAFVSMMKGDAPGATEYLALARNYSVEHKMQHVIPFVEMVDGMLHGGAEDPAGACEHLKDAAERAEAMGMLPVAWQSRAGLAAALEGSGDAPGAEEERGKARSAINAIAAYISDETLRGQFVAAATSRL